MEFFGFENDTLKSGHAFPCTSGHRVGKSPVGKWYRLVGVEESKLGGVQGPMLGGKDGVGLGRNEEWLVGIMMEDKLMGMTGGEMVGWS